MKFNYFSTLNAKMAFWTFARGSYINLLALHREINDEEKL